jgi:GNAT superfamily N-acetyltransferase
MGSGIMCEDVFKGMASAPCAASGTVSEAAASPSGMCCVTPVEMDQLVPLFKGMDETMILSCLQGFMGKAWADRLPNPSCARIVTGDCCFFAGQPNEALVAGSFADHPAAFLLCICEGDAWHPLIERCFSGRFNRFNRYALRKEPDVFSRERLHAFESSLPAGYALVPLRGDLVQAVGKHEWSRDFVSNFRDADDFEARGLGWVVLHEGEPVCGASSYTVYREGIEIQIQTREDHQRRGLARACAAKLILDCLARGLYPSWDAANPESLALAEQLGYHFSHAYVTYEVFAASAPIHPD